MHVNFDTLDAMRQLEISGFTRQQAEKMIEVVKNTQSELATKKDIEVLKKDIQHLENKVDHKIDSLRIEIKTDFKYFKLQIFTALIIMTVIIKPEIVLNIFHFLKI